MPLIRNSFYKDLLKLKFTVKNESKNSIFQPIHFIEFLNRNPVPLEPF